MFKPLDKKGRGLNTYKFIAVLSSVVMFSSCLTGCGGNTAGENITADNETTASENEASENQAASSSPSDSEDSENVKDAEAVENTADVEDEAVSDITAKEESSDMSSYDKMEMRDITPTDLVGEMHTGWNLGNTLDSYGTKGVAAETSWGNPKTTKEMIDTIHAKGFDVIRIPTTWMDHMGEAPDYTVEPEWFDRVEEVINYALDDGMYVILNTHHEEDWRIPDDAHIDEADNQHRILWEQIAEHFKNYGDHLIFEGLNEPRIKGDPHEWDGGTAEVRKCLDRLNKTFVETVRSTGGKNDKRLLLITSVAAAPLPIAINLLEIPEDDHIGASMHAYTPYAFTFDIDESWELNSWDGSHKSDIQTVFRDIKRVFLDKGIPVIITEYGAINKNDDVEDVEKWVTDYLTIAKNNNVPCIWWDNGQFDEGNEHFAIFDRNNLSWYRESVVDCIMNMYSE